jgi:hypothetical protein
LCDWSSDVCSSDLIGNKFTRKNPRFFHITSNIYDFRFHGTLGAKSRIIDHPVFG